MVSLRVLYAQDLSEIAATTYTFWAPPSIQTATFHPSGTLIVLGFDQPTDRAGMDPRNDSCDALILEARAMLGVGSRCIWAANDMLNLFTGRRATVIPGSNLVILSAAGLRSLNRLSMPSVSSAVVTAPARVQPVAIVKSVDVIDACSALEIRATVASPRPLVSYSWRCLNDVDLDGYLSTVAGPMVSLAAGTPEMQTVDKAYIIAFSAVDFLGSSTSQIVVKVFKQGSPAPQVQFNPPSLSITRNKPVLVRGQAVFSSCPVDQGRLSFTWRLISGPANFPAASLGAVIPQIYVPPGTLTAGSTYVLGLRVGNAGDSSQVSEGRFVLQVGNQLLVASIEGGSRRFVSFSSELILSAARSFDPDVSGSGTLLESNQSMSFSWECSVTEDSLRSPCRTRLGTLLAMPEQARIEIVGGVLNPLDVPYEFTATVAKRGRAPSSASMQVHVAADLKPAVSIMSSCIRAEFDQRPCCAVPGGALITNMDSRLIFTGSSDLPNTTFEWALSPAFDPLDITATPLGKSSMVFVFQGSAAVFVPGNSYTVQLLGYGIDSRVPGRGEQSLMVNSPPVGGSFSACLVPADGNTMSVCVSTGVTVVDSFRLSCPSWTDPEGDPILQYRFGYYLVAENASNAPVVGNYSRSESSDPVWFDWAGDSVKEISFPSGLVMAIAQVRDDCGAVTDMLQNAVNVSTASDIGGRRLLAASDFWAKARSKVQGALQTFRPDNVNQLVSSMAAEVLRLSAGSTDAVMLRESLMLSIRVAVDQVCCFVYLQNSFF